MQFEEAVMFFPYSTWRKGQKKIAQEVCLAVINSKCLVMEAPCGLGKTLAVLVGLTPLVSEGFRVIWLARTHNESDKVIEEAKLLNLQSQDLLRGLSLRGKTSSCPLLHGCDEDTAYLACRTLRSELLCPFLDQENLDRCLQHIEENLPLISSQEVVEEAFKFKACPHEVMRKLAIKRSIVSMTYPYLFNPHIRKAYFNSLRIRPEHLVVVIDEAHNLLNILQELNSKKVSLKTLCRALEELSIRGYEKLASSLENLVSELDSMASTGDLDFGVELSFSSLEQLLGLSSSMSFTEYLEELELAVKEMLAIRAVKGLNLRCHAASLYNFLRHLLSLRENSIIWLHNEHHHASPCIEVRSVTAINALSFLSPFRSVICMSGTLAPLKKYVSLIGLQSVRERVKLMRYLRPKVGRAIIIIDNSLSTSLRERHKLLYVKINYKIKLIRENTHQGLGVFVASHRVLQGMVEAGLEEVVPGPLVIDQASEGISNPLERFKKYLSMNSYATFVSVIGGRFSEGVDISSKLMPIAVLVGVPMPEPTVFAEKAKSMYLKMGFEKPDELLYKEPAMRKVSQTIGRLIRSPQDKALVVLMDRRYGRGLVNYLPQWLNYRLIYTDNPLSIIREFSSATEFNVGGQH